MQFIMQKFCVLGVKVTKVIADARFLSTHIKETNNHLSLS